MIQAATAPWPPAYDPAYRPPSGAPYWDAALETLSEDERASVILEKIQRVMAWAYERAPFYRTRWQAAGLEPGDVRSLDDFSRVPTIAKADLRADQAAHPPFGSYLCIDPSEIFRIHGTSGTSGRPTAFAWSRDDYDRIAESHARIMWSFGLRIAETAHAEGVDPRDFGLRIMFFSGEPGAGILGTKRLIEETFGAICIDSGSMGEVTPWMNITECEHRTGMHLWQDIVYTELLDPATMRPLPYGATGTPVYTQLMRRGQPMIRLVSGDQAEWTNDPCPCGRTYPRFPRGIIGRIDDMLVVRGENIYPSAIEDVLHGFPEIGTEFEIVVSRPAALDVLTVRAELAAPCDEAALSFRLAAQLKRRLGIRAEIAFAPAGTLSRTDLKSRRVRDERQTTS